MEAEDGSITSVEAEDGFTTHTTIGPAASRGFVSNSAVFDRNGPRALTMEENTSTTGPENEPKKKVNLETKPEQLSGNETKRVDLEANRIFVGVDVPG